MEKLEKIIGAFMKIFRIRSYVALLSIPLIFQGCSQFKSSQADGISSNNRTSLQPLPVDNRKLPVVDCAAGSFEWTANGNSCFGSYPSIKNRIGNEYNTVTSNSDQIGLVAVACVNGKVIEVTNGPGKSCSARPSPSTTNPTPPVTIIPTPAVTKCKAREVSWSVDGKSCSGSAQEVSLNTEVIVNSISENSGQIKINCINGEFVETETKTCTSNAVPTADAKCTYDARNGRRYFLQSRNGNNIDQSSLTLYYEPLTQNGLNCSSQVLVCNNGVLSIESHFIDPAEANAARTFPINSLSSFSHESCSVISNDILNNTNTTSTLVVDGLAGDSVIEVTDDKDWWRVELIAGETYVIKQNRFYSQLDSYLILRNELGKVLARNDNEPGTFGPNTVQTDASSRIEFSPTVSGKYFLSAGGFSNTTGRYKISIMKKHNEVLPTEISSMDIPDSAATTAVAEIGKLYKSTIHQSRDKDWWKVTLQKDVTYTIYQNYYRSQLDTLLVLRSADGQEITRNDQVQGSFEWYAQIIFKAPATGVYYIEASGFSNSNGDYVFQVSQDATACVFDGGAVDSCEGPFSRTAVLNGFHTESHGPSKISNILPGGEIFVEKISARCENGRWVNVVKKCK